MKDLLLMYFYVPESHVESVKEAIFEAGAGAFDGYDRCAWQTLGQGQFHPLDGAKPFIGRENELETLAEYKVELLLPESIKMQVLEAFKKAHPYEVPAYGFLRHI